MLGRHAAASPGRKNIDLDARIPSDVIAAAAEQIPEIAPAAGMYMSMVAPPSVLTPYQQQVRQLLRTGWLPPVGEGPTRNELATLVRESAQPIPAQARASELTR